MWIIHVISMKRRVLNDSYGVATVSRIDTITGLFCKRTLQKRLFSAKETYNWIDLAQGSHYLEQDRLNYMSLLQKIVCFVGFYLEQDRLNYIWGPIFCPRSFLVVGFRPCIRHVTWLSHGWHESFTCDMLQAKIIWLGHTGHDSFTRDVTHSRVTWLTHVWHDYSHVTWLTLTWHDSPHDTEAHSASTWHD